MLASAQRVVWPWRLWSAPGGPVRLGGFPLGKTAVYVAGTYLARLVTIVALTLLGRFSGVEARGDYGVLVSISEGSSRLGAGGWPEQAARAAAKGEDAEVNGAVNQHRIWAVLGAMAAGVVSLALGGLPWVLPGLIVGYASARRLIWRNIRAGRGELARISLSELIPPALLTAFVSIGHWAFRMPTEIWFSVGTMVVLLGTSILRDPPPRGTRPAKVRLVPSLSSSGMGFWLSGIANYATNRSDVLLVAILLSRTDAGIYATAASISMLVLQLGAALGQAALSTGLPSRALIVKQSLLLLAAATLTAAAGAFLTDLLLVALMGAAFSPAITVAIILLSGAPFAALTALNHQHLVLHGAGRAGMKVQIAVAILVLVFIPVAARTSGVNGVAVATAFLYFIRSVWLFGAAFKHAG